MRSRAYYFTRSVVRVVFWAGVVVASVFALQLFIILVWSLQF